MGSVRIRYLHRFGHRRNLLLVIAIGALGLMLALSVAGCGSGEQHHDYHHRRSPGSRRPPRPRLLPGELTTTTEAVTEGHHHNYHRDSRRDHHDDHRRRRPPPPRSCPPPRRGSPTATSRPWASSRGLGAGRQALHQHRLRRDAHRPGGRRRRRRGRRDPAGRRPAQRLLHPQHQPAEAAVRGVRLGRHHHLHLGRARWSTGHLGRQFKSFWSATPPDAEAGVSERDCPWWIERDGQTVIKIDEQYLP